MGERLHVDQGRAHREGISLYSVQIALVPSNVVLRIAEQETLFAFFEFSSFRLFARLASRKQFSHFLIFRVFALSRVWRPGNTFRTFRLFAFSPFRASLAN